MRSTRKLNKKKKRSGVNINHKMITVRWTRVGKEPGSILMNPIVIIKIQHDVNFDKETLNLVQLPTQLDRMSNIYTTDGWKIVTSLWSPNSFSLEMNYF